ncbi:MAG: hypothetical protein JW976_14885 [Syntrophaceae bacterium]|nr:hypothetical protein [Syntrophaceae bacterium]
MEKIFYYSNRNLAIKSIAWAFLAVSYGIICRFFGNLVIPHHYIIVAYFCYAVSFCLVFVSIWFALTPNKKYIVLTESKIKIMSRKNSIEIPRSQISSAQLCESPIKYRFFTGVGVVFFPDVCDTKEGIEVCVVLKLSLIETSEEIIDNKSRMEKQLFESQLFYISDDKKQIYIRKAPVEGFEALVRALNENV